MKFFLPLMMLFWNAPLWACTVCGFGNEKSQWAFILTTGILTFVPLFFIGGVVFYLVKHSNQASVDE